MLPAGPGSAQGLYLVVSDIERARAALAERGIKISDVFHITIPGAQFQLVGNNGRVNGPAPGHDSYRSYATFSDNSAVGFRWPTGHARRYSGLRTRSHLCLG